MTGCTIARSNGPVFARTFVRDPYRKHLINAVSNSFDGIAVHSTSYAYDLLSRRTNILYTAQSGTNILSCAYNARSEVTGVTIDTNEYAYIYDNIGNNLYTSLNAITNAYSVNNLNQYKGITNLLDLTGYWLLHDFDGNTTRIGEHSLYYDAENRLASYMFGLDANETGTVRNAYSYDHFGRRVRTMRQDYRVYAPGGITPPTYWWHTNEVTTFVYDGWNLIHESVAHTNGTVDEIEYVWGLDLSGSLQGAGGVGGLLFEKRNGVIYIPCYDANGNITAYVDTNGTVRASYIYDAFGKTISQSGDMADLFRFRFSTKYFDTDTGLYYYGYRYYSSMLQRWINRDPIEERGGKNLYLIGSNDPMNKWDKLGLWGMWRKPNQDELTKLRVRETRIANKAKILLRNMEGFADTLTDTGWPIRDQFNEKYTLPNLPHLDISSLDSKLKQEFMLSQWVDSRRFYHGLARIHNVLSNLSRMENYNGWRVSTCLNVACRKEIFDGLSNRHTGNIGICSRFFDESSSLNLLTIVMVHEGSHMFPSNPVRDYYYDQIWNHTVNDAYVYGTLFDDI